MNSTTVDFPTQLPTPPAMYAPGTIRRGADRQRSVVDAFVAKYPQYARLAPDVLAQYAATYRDDKDHALEQEFRDNGVLTGARVDHGRRREDGDWDEVPTSDNSFDAAREALEGKVRSG
jgi:hypothetical protein